VHVKSVQQLIPKLKGPIKIGNDRVRGDYRDIMVNSDMPFAFTRVSSSAC
jgi:hypothetical protein